MLTINQRKLYGRIELSEPETEITIQEDEACHPVGVVTFSDGSVKSVHFERKDGIHVGILSLTRKEAQAIGKALFHVRMVGASFSQKTNAIPISVKEDLLKRSFTETESDEIVKLRAEIESLKETIASLASGKAMKIMGFPKGTPIEPGMVPVAIDGKGTFVPSHPFANLVKEVNGVKSVDGSITLDSSMIEYGKGTPVSEYLKALADAIDAEHKLALALRDRINILSDQLNSLEIRVSARIDGGSM